MLHYKLLDQTDTVFLSFKAISRSKKLKQQSLWIILILFSIFIISVKYVVDCSCCF